MSQSLYFSPTGVCLFVSLPVCLSTR